MYAIRSYYVYNVGTSVQGRVVTQHAADAAAIGKLIERGADVDLLAGNHDVRALVGFVYLGRREPQLAHLFRNNFV